MHRLFLLVVLLLFTAGENFAQNTDNPDAVTFQQLLKEMRNPAALARWPDKEWRNMQVSTLKTENRDNPGGFDTGHFAHKEIGNFIRIEKNGGRKEWVLMDHKGPGTIMRMWAPNMAKDAILRIYFDGNTQPSIEVNMMDFFYGEGFVKPPFAALKARGGNVYLPIPFEKGCKITVDEFYSDWARPKLLFYIIQYRAYDKGTSVKTFDLKQYKKSSKLLTETAQALEYPQVEQKNPEVLIDEKIAAGETEEIVLQKGSKAINYLKVQIDAKEMTEALRSTLLKLSFDGKETVHTPIGDFFGSGSGLNPFDDWMRTVEKNSKMICRWVMPYKETAKLALEVTGNEDIKVKLVVNYRLWEWDDRSMYFHSNWGLDRGIDILPVPNFNFISIKGRGVYVGETLSVTSYSSSWWGEGPEKITVDGTPTQFGTGSEDYFGYAWGKREIFEAPFHAQPRIPEGPDFFGTTVNTRIRSLDAISFHSSLNLDIEILTQDSNKGKFAEVSYGVATYWYGFADTKGKWIRKPARMQND